MRNLCSLIGLIFWGVCTLILVVTFFGIIVVIEENTGWARMGRQLVAGVTK